MAQAKGKAVVLLSGGLDSTLAACMMLDQGIELQAVNFKTIFTCCKDDARQVAHDLGIKFTLLSVQDDYLELVEKPKHGRGRGMNPCIDCRGYMFELAKKVMDDIGATFLVSGEVVGQRPMSQKKKDLSLIERSTGLEGKILRPLSAKLLSPTEPELQGIVDREKLLGIQGRSRKRLVELARHYKIKDIPQPSNGCSLTQPLFSKKVKDLYDHADGYDRWEFEVLKIGRHFRLNDTTKVIIARNNEQNDQLKSVHPQGTALLECDDFGGPHALVIGSQDRDTWLQACALMLYYSKYADSGPRTVKVTLNGEETALQTDGALTESELEPLRIV